MSNRAAVARRVPLPRIWPVTAFDLAVVVAVNGLVILGMWVRHGGLDALGSIGGVFTGVGQLTALGGTYLALLQLVLMSRSPWLDQLFGMHRLSFWHHWVGLACVWLIGGHAVLTTIGFALTDGHSVVTETWSLLTAYPYVLMATVGLGLLVLVVVESIAIARRRLSYDTWYHVHLYAYLAIALGFAHELVVGTDFINDPIARIYWVALYVAVVACILVFRVGAPFGLWFRHRMRVANVVPEAPGVVSVYLTGRDLDRLPVRAGQYFIWRFLARHGWWRPHPFSLSAAPNGQFLRLTIKDQGDDTNALQRLRPGTPVFAEGPYGTFTGAARTRSRAVLIAGGIGITPLRALLEELPTGKDGLVLVYRARSWQDILFKTELDLLAETRGATIHYLVGRRGDPEMRVDPLGPRTLHRLVPDIHRRDVYLCGSDAMMAHVRRGLEALDVAPSQIHSERFAY